MKSSAPVTELGMFVWGLPGRMAGPHINIINVATIKLIRTEPFYHFSNDICMVVCPPLRDGEWVIVNPCDMWSMRTVTQVWYS